MKIWLVSNIKVHGWGNVLRFIEFSHIRWLPSLLSDSLPAGIATGEQSITLNKIKYFSGIEVGVQWITKLMFEIISRFLSHG